MERQNTVQIKELDILFNEGIILYTDTRILRYDIRSSLFLTSIKLV